jgi:hypothetical protein
MFSQKLEISSKCTPHALDYAFSRRTFADANEPVAQATQIQERSVANRREAFPTARIAAINRPFGELKDPVGKFPGFRRSNTCVEPPHPISNTMDVKRY